MQKDSVRPEEIARFDALAARWWDPSGPMQPLHMMNPCRAGWILERIRRKFGGSDVNVLDVGCGAGLLSESLAAAGCNVLGLDAGVEAIAAAKAHAEGSVEARGLRLAYRADTAEALAAEGQKYSVITALEIIEHVADPAAFVATLASLLEPGGLMFLSTLNRTAKSYMVAKFGAEYLLRLLPVGTHNWRRFVTPEELGRFCRGAGLRLADSAGMSFSPLQRRFAITRDMSINYIAMAES
jgi:2-polyprenyl-6-hydroxyphenyl methylase / 3-demethylubiquinone-9 3-methyltransferase